MQTEIKQDLNNAYRSAHYKVCDGAEQFILRVDEHSLALEALYGNTKQSSALFITAFNADGQQQDNARNGVAQEALLRDLRSNTKHVFAGIGEDPNGIWPGEPSWLALGMDLTASQALGNLHHQNAVLWADSDAVPRLILLR
jgi:hypothetical protein